MPGMRLLIKIASGLAASGAAAALALSSPLTAAATVSSVTVYPPNPPPNEATTWSGLIASATGDCENHCSASIDWGDGFVTNIDDTGANRNNVYSSHLWFEEGTRPIIVTVKTWFCVLGCFNTSTAVGASTVAIPDTPLTSPSNTVLNLAEGVGFTGVVGSFVDPNPLANAADFSATINWGDGTSSLGTIGNSFGRWTISMATPKIYRTAGTYAISTHVADHGATINIPASANVSDAALSATGQSGGWLAGSAATANVAQFTDPNMSAVASDFTVTIAWGDGTTSSGTVTQTSSQHFNVSGTHTYAYAGSYTATTSIADIGGASATTTSAESVSQALLLPAVSNAAYGGYTSVIYIQNVGAAPANVNILYYNQSGASVGSGQFKTGLASNANWTVRQDDGMSFAAGQAGWALITSDQRLSVFVNEFGPGGGDATSYSAIRFPNDTGTTLYEPAIANNAYGGYTTGTGLVNFGSATNLTVTYRDALGVIVKTQPINNVAAGAYVPIYSGDPALALPSGFAGTATIVRSNAGSLAAVVNETGPNGQFSSYDAVNAGSTSLFAPVALNNAYGGFFTGIGIQNTSNAAGTVTVDYFDTAGTPTEKVRSIAAYGYLALYQGDPTDGPPASATGYTAQVSSTVPVAAIVNEVTPPTGGVTTTSSSYNTFVAGTSQSNVALVESSGSDGWSTGLGVMNTGSTSVTITLAYFDAATGAPIGTPQTQTLAPKAFWGPYQPTAGLPAGTRATAILTTSAGGKIVVICNEAGTGTFMSFNAQ